VISGAAALFHFELAFVYQRGDRGDERAADYAIDHLVAVASVMAAAFGKDRAKAMLQLAMGALHRKRGPHRYARRGTKNNPSYWYTNTTLRPSTSMKSM